MRPSIKGDTDSKLADRPASPLRAYPGRLLLLVLRPPLAGQLPGFGDLGGGHPVGRAVPQHSKVIPDPVE